MMEAASILNEAGAEVIPKLGDIIRRRRTHGNGYIYTTQKYIRHACESCGKERWVRLLKDGKPRSTKCIPCINRERLKGKKGPACHNFRGRRRTLPSGYIVVWIGLDKFFSNMADKYGFVREHRLVMAQHLGRCLQTWEEVHHKNGIKDDNRWENFELHTKGQHTSEHLSGYKHGYESGYVDGRDARVRKLLNENKLLRAQLCMTEVDNGKPV